MGNETILYYVTQDTITGVTKEGKPEKKAKYVDHGKWRFRRKISLPSFVVESGGLEITVITVMIPPLRKGWKPEKLLKQMRETAESYRARFPDMEILLHPQIERMLGRDEGQSQTAMSAIDWFLAGRLFTEIMRGGGECDNVCYFKRGCGNRPASVVLMLGNLLFPEEQMQRFLEWMTPYFPYVNRLFVWYDAEEDGQMNEESIQQELEDLYYEYGLVSQIQCGKGSALKRRMAESGQSPVFFLDFGYAGGVPFGALKKGDFYLDLFSDEKKEALFRRKYMEISYASARKCLDTLVKSGYDK
ncbi:MAG: hypothetical protein NC434_00965 [Ruminococcus sp.]|nr:hypothetical protein [Ruminococcus sp.]